jgi:electron transfer flavoprotein alpha subunit
MSEIRRIDPRRQYRVSSEGVRRIVLGERCQDGGSAAFVDHAGSTLEKKPLRFRTETTGWMMAVVYADRGRLDLPARQAIAAAAVLASPADSVVAVVLGELTDEVASVGADHVVVLPAFDATIFQPETASAAIVQLIEKYAAKHIFVPDRQELEGDLGRRLILSLGETFATNVVEIAAQSVVTSRCHGRGLYSSALPRVVLLRPGIVELNLPFSGMAERLGPLDVPSFVGGEERFRDLGIITANSAAVPLEEAEFVIAAGNGVTNVAAFKSLAVKLGATIGASRVAVDDGRFARELQVGASGKSVSASTYIAIGISGAVQHLQGIKDCRRVIAINRDASAPIAKRADLTVVGDAEEIIQAMLENLGRDERVEQMPGAA